MGFPLNVTTDMLEYQIRRLRRVRKRPPAFLSLVTEIG
jgi:hypothetical protein